MVVETIKGFAKSKGFVQISPAIRTNVNGYPFITFINAKNEAENVYFSKNSAKAVGAGQPVVCVVAHFQLKQEVLNQVALKSCGQI